MTTTPNPVYVALDTPDVKTALALAGAVRPHVGGLKVGLEFVSANGPEGVRAVAALGLPVFLDVKLHDIPNTVAGAVRALSGLGVSIVNVHASGGTAMMRAAKEAAGSGVKIIAVTILTSLDDADARLACADVSSAVCDMLLPTMVMSSDASISAEAVPAICGKGAIEAVII